MYVLQLKYRIVIYYRSCFRLLATCILDIKSERKLCKYGEEGEGWTVWHADTVRTELWWYIINRQFLLINRKSKVIHSCLEIQIIHQTIIIINKKQTNKHAYTMISHKGIAYPLYSDISNGNNKKCYFIIRNRLVLQPDWMYYTILHELYLRDTCVHFYKRLSRVMRIKQFRNQTPQVQFWLTDLSIIHIAGEMSSNGLTGIVINPMHAQSTNRVRRRSGAWRTNPPLTTSPTGSGRCTSF